MYIQFGVKKIESINIITATHSPFILSDIPANNILRLKDGNPELFKNNEQTFGANINNILANDFFLKNGFMGDFVKGKINSLINFIEQGEIKNDEWSIETAKEFIGLIGEPLIRTELMELYLSVFYDDRQIDLEIERLQKIKKEKNNKDNDSN